MVRLDPRYAAMPLSEKMEGDKMVLSVAGLNVEPWWKVFLRGSAYKAFRVT